jgi:hypothetical protein
MNTDLKLVLEFSHVPNSMHLMIRDRNSLIAEVLSIDNSLVELNFKFSLPNQLLFDLKKIGVNSSSVTLKKIVLGGLELTSGILEQICQFTPIGAEKYVILPIWGEGKVNIDFFASDWVQYHLLHGNKIIT